MVSEAPVTKSAYAYSRIKAAILDGHMAPGHRLRLTELAGQFGVSEMPIREALRMLQHDGLVHFANHRGAVVNSISHNELVDIISVRTYLEILAATEAVRFHTSKTIGVLEKTLVQMDADPDNKAFSKLNHEFHENLIKPSPNKFLLAEIQALWDRVWKRWSQSIFEVFPERKSHAMKEHERILSAVKADDPEAVKLAMEIHRNETLSLWRRNLLAGDDR